ncbi:hypothetical protein ACHAXR_007612, partial [Thalassiosira sp. AJA248-18]
MFKVHSIALTAALFGYASAATGCYPTWTSSGTYVEGSWVSATTQESVTAPCTGTTNGCVNGSVTTTVSKTYNYKCLTSNGWCLTWDPAVANTGQAWDKESAACSVSFIVMLSILTLPPLPALFVNTHQGTANTPAAPTAPTPAAWSGGGCPAAYSGGTSYATGNSVSVNMGTYTMVYTCKDGANSAFCGMAGYEPGTSQYWGVAWTEQGSCTGTIAPTKSPTFTTLTDVGGCPSEYSAGEDYEEGDKVSKDGFVFQCKAGDVGKHCSQAGYEPGTSIGSGDQIAEYWKDAWTVIGYCDGTIAPTTAPNYVSLKDMGGCPEAWERRTESEPYEEGDRVSNGGLVFTCKGWPLGQHCGQDGYEPNTNPATPDAWKVAWTVAGHCDGSIAPTSAPVFEDLALVGACPDEWERGDNVKYEEGDLVGMIVSDVPLRKVAFKCKAWPYSGFCGQFSPTEYGGNQGWALAGQCTGSIGPTSSPSFVTIKEVTGGCPQEWSSSTTDYEAGDKVSYTVSTSPERKLVYKCRDWPNSGYCGQGAYEPGTQYGDMAWTLLGSCSGTISP